MHVLLFRLRALAPALACALLLTWLAATPGHARDGQPQMDLPRTTLSAGIYRVEAQVASTASQRQTGLMFRREMADYEGMLFVFPEPSRQCFWMKNTLIPLSIAFLRDDGSIVNLADMEPLDERSHCSDQPVRYVLEVNQGWFAQRKLGPGQRLRGEPFQAEP